MAISAKFTAAVNDLLAGRNNTIFEIDYDGKWLGQANVTFSTEMDYLDVVSPAGGSQPVDRIVTGVNMSLSVTFLEMSEDLLSVVLPGVFDDQTGGNMIIESKCFSENTFEAPLKIYTRTGCTPNEGAVLNVAADPSWSFYHATFSPTGDVLSNDPTALRSAPFTVRLRAEQQDVNGTIRNILGYEGNNVTLGVTAIA